MTSRGEMILEGVIPPLWGRVAAIVTTASATTMPAPGDAPAFTGE